MFNTNCSSISARKRKDLKQTFPGTDIELSLHLPAFRLSIAAKYCIDVYRLCEYQKGQVAWAWRFVDKTVLFLLLFFN